MFKYFAALATSFLLTCAPAFAHSSSDQNAWPDYSSATSRQSTNDGTGLPEFDRESQAQAHCPSDEVVWLNTNSGIYHEKGMRWYGNTRQGAYVCRKEADASGDRDTRNGQ